MIICSCAMCSTNAFPLHKISQERSTKRMKDYILYPLVTNVAFAVVYLIVRFCKKRQDAVRRESGIVEDTHIHSGAPPTSAGVDKELIDALPVIEFSSLSCSSGGITECAICLAQFEGTDAHHLLPKCRHAFHAGCIRQWLPLHSSCPVCRQMVEVEDFTSFACLNGLLNPESVEETIEIDMFGDCVQQENEAEQGLMKEMEGCSNSSDGGNANRDDPQGHTSQFSDRIAQVSLTEITTKLQLCEW